MTEIWKDIEGYEGLYQVSNLGRIKSLHPHSNKAIKPIILKADNVRGYPIVQLHKAATKDRFLIHKLVALAYIPKAEGKNEVNHKDGNKLNNTVSNLEWVTRRENMKHAYKHKLVDTVKAQNANKKAVYQYDLKGNFIKKYCSCTEAKKETGATNISMCISGKRKTSGGYIWRLA